MMNLSLCVKNGGDIKTAAEANQPFQREMLWIFVAILFFWLFL